MTASNPLHPKRAGSRVESVVVDTEPTLTTVGDSEATWHDAATVDQLTATPERPLDGWSVVPSDTPVEIKAAVPEHQNGDGTVPGRWYLKRKAHGQLVAADGVYYLTVYAPKPETPVIAARVIPAEFFDVILNGRWYECRGRDVARISWTTVIDRERVYGGGRT